MLRFISSISIGLGVLCLLMAAIVHTMESISLMGVTHWGFVAGSICLFLFSIALNTFIPNQEE